MPKTPPMKKPCSICRKWFLPHVRQKGRQVTCSPACRKERHRRKCAQWNRKNRVHSKSNYLNKKLEQTAEPPSKVNRSGFNKNASVSGNRINLHLPREILRDELGEKNLIIIDYLIEQILARVRLDSGLIPVKKKLVVRQNEATIPDRFSRHIDNINTCNNVEYKRSNPFGFLRGIDDINNCK